MSELHDDLFDRFGKLITNHIRDTVIDTVTSKLTSKQMPALLDRFQPELADLSSKQSAMMQELVAYAVDVALHSMFYEFENQNWIRIQLLDSDGQVVVNDLREVAKGDLNGYPFIWAEKFSNTLLSALIKITGCHNAI